MKRYKRISTEEDILLVEGEMEREKFLDSHAIEEMKDEELKSATVWKIKVGAEGYEEEIFSLLIDWYQDEIFISSELKKKN